MISEVAWVNNTECCVEAQQFLEIFDESSIILRFEALGESSILWEWISNAWIATRAADCHFILQ